MPLVPRTRIRASQEQGKLTVPNHPAQIDIFKPTHFGRFRQALLRPALGRSLEMSEMHDIISFLFCTLKTTCHCEFFAPRACATFLCSIILLLTIQCECSIWFIMQIASSYICASVLECWHVQVRIVTEVHVSSATQARSVGKNLPFFLLLAESYSTTDDREFRW